MLDILVIILVFLLKSYATSTNSFSTVPGLKLPISRATVVPPDSLHLIVTPEAITFDNVRIVEFTQSPSTLGSDTPAYEFKSEDLDEQGLRVIPLFDALTRAREKSELLRAKSKARDASGNPLPFNGAIAIQADKRIKYDTLRKIMYTAGAAQYGTFRLLALRMEQ
jgi:biopolymer transport protein ExbD